MKKIAIIGIIVSIITCIVIAGCVAEAPKNPITITYFYSPGCEYCNMMDKDFERLESVHPGEFNLTKIDVNKNQEQFRETITRYNVDSVVPFIIIGNVTFSGYRNTTYKDIEELVITRAAFNH